MRARRFLAAFLAVFASRASRVAAAEPLADGSASSAASAPWSFEPWAGDRGLDLDDANAWVSRLRRRAEDIADARDDVDAAYRPLFASVSDASERPRAGVDAFRGAGGLDRWRGRGWRFDDVDDDDDEPPSSSAATPDPLDGVGEVVLDALELSSDVLAVTAPSAAEASAEAGAIIAEQAELAELADAFSVAGGENKPKTFDRFVESEWLGAYPNARFMASVANANAFPVSIGVGEEAPSFDVPNFAAGVAAGAAAFARKAYEKAFDDAERRAHEDFGRKSAAKAIEKTLEMQRNAPVFTYRPSARSVERASALLEDVKEKARANANANARDVDADADFGGDDEFRDAAREVEKARGEVGALEEEVGAAIEGGRGGRGGSERA